MKKTITGCLMAMALIAWLASSAQPWQADNKTLEELMVTHDPVAVTTDTDGAYITLVKGGEVVDLHRILTRVLH